MARRNSYISNMFAMGAIVCIPTAIFCFLSMVILENFLFQNVVSFLGPLGLILVFLGGLFFILHFIFKIIEMGEKDIDYEILDDEMIS